MGYQSKITHLVKVAFFLIYMRKNLIQENATFTSWDVWVFYEDYSLVMDFRYLSSLWSDPVRKDLVSGQDHARWLASRRETLLCRPGQRRGNVVLATED